MGLDVQAHGLRVGHRRAGSSSMPRSSRPITRTHEIKAVSRRLRTRPPPASAATSPRVRAASWMPAGHPAMLFVDGVSVDRLGRFPHGRVGRRPGGLPARRRASCWRPAWTIVGVSPMALAACETAKCPRCFFDFRDMAGANAKGGFPYTPPLQVMYGLRESLSMLFEEGLDNVFARHFRIAEGVREAVRAWDLQLCARSPDLYSDTVSAIYVPEGYDSDILANHAFDVYGVFLRDRPRPDGGQGLSHRTPGFAHRRHGAFGPCGDRNGDERSELSDRTRIRRLSGTAALPQYGESRPQAGSVRSI